MAKVRLRNSNKLRWFFLSCIIILSAAAVATLVAVLLFAFAAAALVILISKRHAIREWRSSEVIHRTYLSCFFSSLGMIVFLIVMGLMMVYSFTLLITPI